MGKQFIKEDQKKILVRIADSEGSVDSIEEGLLSSRRSYGVLVSFAIIFFLAGGVVFFIGLFRNADFLLIAVGAILYVLGWAWNSSASRKNPEYVIFQSLIKCMKKTEEAKGSQAMSDKRKPLSSQLTSCSLTMRVYSPWFPIGLSKRIAAREARLMRLFIKNLVYPSLLGTDGELDKIKEVAAKAALKVGAGNWFDVRTLDVDTSNYPTAESFQRWGQGLWTGMQRLLLLVPPIAVIIGGLIKYHADIFG